MREIGITNMPRDAPLFLAFFVCVYDTQQQIDNLQAAYSGHSSKSGITLIIQSCGNIKCSKNRLYFHSFSGKNGKKM